MLLNIVFLLASLAAILAAATLFVNSVEWAGKRFDLSQGAVGSILAAVGTALPESIIPVIAIFFTGGHGGHDVGIGAILGAPLLLSTLAMALAGISLIVYGRSGARKRHLVIDNTHFRSQMLFFLCVYAAAVGLGLLDLGVWRYPIAALFLVAYGLFVRWILREHVPSEHDDLARLTLGPRNDEPKTWMIFVQIAFSLLLLVVGAHLFVTQVSQLAEFIGISALVLSLIIAPIATELPEKLNSVIWIGQRKDQLALGNLTGAMAFQSTLPVALGIAFTPWNLEGSALVAAVMALIGASIMLFALSSRNPVRPPVLFLAGLPYLGFVGYIIAQG